MIGTFQRQSGETFLEFDNQISSEKLGIPLLASSSHHPDYLHLSWLSITVNETAWEKCIPSHTLADNLNNYSKNGYSKWKSVNSR